MKFLSNVFWFLGLFWVLQNVTYFLSEPGRNRDSAMSKYQGPLRGSMLLRHPDAPLLYVPGVRAEDIRVKTDFRFLTLEHPKLSVQVCSRDFQKSFAHNDRRKKEMRTLGFEGVIYSTGAREWIFRF